ncbi:MAG: signal peptidase II [Bacillota bacterium]|nr:signal peptidase II [Bacillota bacterium]
MYIFYAILTAAMVILDFVTKNIVAGTMKSGDTIPVLKGVFHITYCENTGAAFSMFSGKPYILAVVSAAVMVGLIVYIIFKKPTNHVFMFSLALIVAGGIGNMIDRIFRGYVVDFFDFRLINFAIFNVADTFVTCGVILFGIYLFFIQKKADE